MAIYVRKPEAIEAVKWDGTDKSKGEVSKFLNKHGAGIDDICPDGSLIIAFDGPWHKRVLGLGSYVSWNKNNFIGFRSGDFFEKLFMKL